MNQLLAVTGRIHLISSHTSESQAALTMNYDYDNPINFFTVSLHVQCDGITQQGKTFSVNCMNLSLN